MMVFQQIIDSIEGLSIEDQDYLFELIRKGGLRIGGRKFWLILKR